jgi:small subunit ribosomal protein S6
MESTNQYESMFILNQALSKEDTDKLIDRFHTVLASQSADLVKTERMGKRKMAYWVKGQEEGFYVLFQFRSKPEAVTELERQFRFSDQVLKFQTLKVVPFRPVKVKPPKVKAGIPRPVPAAEPHA